MNAEPIITDELAERLQRLLGEVLRLPSVDVQAFALKAREYGVALVDPARKRSWIDESVYAGALFRMRHADKRTEALVAEVRRVARERDDYRRQADSAIAECLDAGDETTGEFDE